MKELKRLQSLNQSYLTAEYEDLTLKFFMSELIIKLIFKYCVNIDQINDATPIRNQH